MMDSKFDCNADDGQRFAYPIGETISEETFHYDRNSNPITKEPALNGVPGPTAVIDGQASPNRNPSTV